MKNKFYAVIFLYVLAMNASARNSQCSAEEKLFLHVVQERRQFQSVLLKKTYLRNTLSTDMPLVAKVRLSPIVLTATTYLMNLIGLL
jgi:hypothetical protein